MPFAVVLTRASRYFNLRLSRLSVWKGMPGSGLCPLSTLRHLVNLQARNALRQGFPLFSANPLRTQRLCVILAFRFGPPPVNQDNACALPKHLLTVEMLPGPARDGPLL
jgi:hypothetical protein